MMRHVCVATTLLAAAGVALAAAPGDRDKRPNTAQVLASAKADDWRRPDPANTLYMELAGGRVIIELAPRFAPLHVANIKSLVAQKYFDGLGVIRVQDNYVVQWGDSEKKPPNENALRKIADESVVAWGSGLPFVKLPDPDGYAPEAGWIDRLSGRRPANAAGAGMARPLLWRRRRRPRTTRRTAAAVPSCTWCIGQAPRHLDRNIVTVGRVLRGAELLSSLPRGTGALGFYEKSEQRTPIRSVRLATEVPAADRSLIEVLRTDTPLFTRYVESRRNRREEWFLVPAGHIDVCNINIPVRDVAVPVRETPASLPSKRGDRVPEPPRRRNAWQCDFGVPNKAACL